MSRQTLVALLSGAVIGFGISSPAAANLLVNGGFELGPNPGESMTLDVGSTALTGWVVTRNAIDYCGTRWQAPEGACSIGLNGTQPGGVAQTFETLPGAEYTATFFHSGDPFFGMTNLRVAAAEQSETLQFDTSHVWPWDMAWDQNSFVFTASSDQTTLEFYSLDVGEMGPAVDSVVVLLTDVTDVDGNGGLSLALSAPHPSPSSGPTQLTFSLPAAGPARLSVHDVRGREVAVLINGWTSAGRNEVAWNASEKAPGVYYVRLDALGQVRVRPLVVIP